MEHAPNPFLDKHNHYALTLKLKSKMQFLQSLETAGIHPDGVFCSLD